MIRKSLKYFIIATVNLTILIFLLVLWTDKLELTCNGFVRLIEILKIIGFTILSLLGMRLLIIFFRKKHMDSIKSKIIVAALLTFLISSYLYIDYSVKIVNNLIINGQFRSQISDKIKPSNYLAEGTRADNLTNKEYKALTSICSFPTIPSEAININYLYGYDGFLPDYIFTLTYDLPTKIKVDTFHYSKGDFEQYREVETIGDIQRITYCESQR